MGKIVGPVGIPGKGMVRSGPRRSAAEKLALANEWAGFLVKPKPKLACEICGSPATQNTSIAGVEIDVCSKCANPTVEKTQYESLWIRFLRWLTS